MGGTFGEDGRKYRSSPEMFNRHLREELSFQEPSPAAFKLLIVEKIR